MDTSQDIATESAAESVTVTGAVTGAVTVAVTLAATVAVTLAATVAVTTLLAACWHSTIPVELVRAARLDGVDDAAALAGYERAAAPCFERVGDSRLCGEALLGRASALARLGESERATRAFEGVAAALPGEGPAAAHGLAEAARLRLAAGDAERAYALAWRAIVNYADENGAEDALVLVVRDGRGRAPRQLVAALVAVHAAAPESELADNLLWQVAGVAEKELGDPAAAVAALDRLAGEHPESSLFDDALWRAAALARRGGDPAGAAARLEHLLAANPPRRSMIGSYVSALRDDARLELALILRDDLGRPRDALAELERLPRESPRSSLQDDALLERAVTRDRLGDRPGACRDLAELARRFPDSRPMLERGPALAAELGCARAR